MTKKTRAIPVAHAVPIGPTAASTEHHGISFVDIDVGVQNVGFTVKGIPPQITFVDPKVWSMEQLVEGQYIHGLILPDIEIVCLADPQHLMNLLNANTMNHRRLMVSMSPFFVDSSLGDYDTKIKGALYKHKLPATSSLGVAMKGFPPIITVVAPTSPLAGRLHPGQTVESLLIPGQPAFNLKAGGFTSARVEQRLVETCHLEGRQLVVKDGHKHTQEKGTSRAMDDCVIC